MKQTTKTIQFLRVIITLSRGRYYTIKMLCEELEIDTRTIYRYVNDLKESGFFTFEKRGKKFRLSQKSLFWVNVINSLYISDDEALKLDKLLENVDDQDKTLKMLKRKVRHIVGNYVAPLDNDADAHLVQNSERLQAAIDSKSMCLLRGYTSLHSQTKSDRLVEPFRFLGSKNDVRCYELATQMNKTFKVSRCESVEVLDVNWQFEKRHKQVFTDIFHFSDENKTRVRLLLGTTAKTILLEEYPEAEEFLMPHTDGRWMLDAEYCSMKGVGRFYMGLFDDIEIVGSPEFREYLRERIKLIPEL